MTHYVYAPKDDPKHRERWREPYDKDELAGFERFAADGTLSLGFAISPGLSIDYASGDDRHALLTKVEQLVARGVTLVCLALDDIPFRPRLGEDHASLTTWLHGKLGERADLVLVPTEYVGGRPTPYLDALAAGVPPDVTIAWTGEAVVNDAITGAHARARAVALGDRPPLLWDNYPVNDAVMADRLFLGPLRGREPALLDACVGYLSNPMVQPRASMLPLASVAAYLRGDDPVAAWRQDAEQLGWTVFAEACDGTHPCHLAARAADEGDRSPLVSWLEAAAVCEAPGLEVEAAPWLDQVHREARLGLRALRVVAAARDGDVDTVMLELFGVMARWPAVRRAEVAVMGPRCSFRPVLVQRADGRWAVDRAALTEDANAVDALVRWALDEAAALA